MSLSISQTSRLQHQYETLSELVRGIPEEQLKLRVIPEKWSAFEQIAHLTAYQPVFLQRMVAIGLEQGLSFERYVADNDPVFHDCCKKALKELSDDLATQRFLIIRHLTDLPEQSLRRNARHPKFGLLSIPGWTEFFLLHEAHHLFSIFMLTQELKQKLLQS